MKRSIFKGATGQKRGKKFGRKREKIRKRKREIFFSRVAGKYSQE
jgi:hypothetical protein